MDGGATGGAQATTTMRRDRTSSHRDGTRFAMCRIDMLLSRTDRQTLDGETNFSLLYAKNAAHLTVPSRASRGPTLHQLSLAGRASCSLKISGPRGFPGDPC